MMNLQKLSTLSLSVLSLQLLILGDFYRCSSATPLKGNYLDIITSAYSNYSFVVAIERICDSTVVCTGSLITDRHVLTAKHCLHYDKKENLQVSLGHFNRAKATKHDILSYKTFLQWTNETGIPHKHYGARDIAVITLAKPVTSKLVKPVRITEKKNTDFIRKAVEIVGWGETDAGSTQKLRRGLVKIQTADQCEVHIEVVFHRRGFKLGEDQFCSYSPTKQRLAFGDHGGPLLFENELIGINLHPIIVDGVDSEDEPNLHLGIERYKPFVKSFIDKPKADGEACEI